VSAEGSRSSEWLAGDGRVIAVVQYQGNADGAAKFLGCRAGRSTYSAVAAVLAGSWSWLPPSSWASWSLIQLFSRPRYSRS
jgi:hypothetical protein